MSEIILSVEEIQALNIRNGIIQQEQTKLTLLMGEKELYQKILFDKYGLDAKKQYSIDARGVITETIAVKEKEDE